LCFIFTVWFHFIIFLLRSNTVQHYIIYYHLFIWVQRCYIILIFFIFFLNYESLIRSQQSFILINSFSIGAYSIVGIKVSISYLFTMPTSIFTLLSVDFNIGTNSLFTVSTFLIHQSTLIIMSLIITIVVSMTPCTYFLFSGTYEIMFW
jgi:hypothetical protein